MIDLLSSRFVTFELDMTGQQTMDFVEIENNHGENSSTFTQISETISEKYKHFIRRDADDEDLTSNEEISVFAVFKDAFDLF